MTMKETLLKISELGVGLETSNGNLKIVGDPDVLTEEIIEELKQNKTSIISYLEKKNTDHEITPVEKADAYDVSSAQRRLWVLDQMDANHSIYNMSGAYTFTGKFSKETFNKAFETIVQRHESLRTTFTTIDGIPKQKINQNTFSIEYIDLTETKNPEEEAKRLGHEEIVTGFHLEKGPLIRGKILSVSKDTQVFLFTMHHIISDGWSVSVLIKEIVSLYNAYLMGNSNSLPDLKLQYKDFAAWQNRRINDDSSTSKSYWLDVYKTMPDPLYLPYDYKRPKIKTYSGQSIQYQLDGNISKALKTLSRESGCTMYMVLLTGFYITLLKYSGQRDITIGSVVSGRENEDLEQLIGFFVNTLSLRLNSSADDRVSDILSHVKSTTLNAFEHQNYPFDQLVEDLKLEKDLSRNPLFDVVFVLQSQNERIERSNTLSDVNVGAFSLDRITTKFDLMISAIESQNEIILDIEYNSDLFKSGTIELFLKHLENIYRNITDNSNAQISEIEYLSSSEKEEQLNLFNSTKTHLEKNRSIIDLFEEQVERDPDKVAVVYENIVVTYGELNRKANQLAHYLNSSFEIKSDQLIGVILERSEWMVISILGILKAGAAYLPIDIDSPTHRQLLMLKDSDAIYSIIDNQLNIEEFSDYQVIALDDLKTKLISQSTDNSVHKRNPNDLSYVMYTSGSTGVPKGVMVEDLNIIRLVKNTNYIDFKVPHRLLQTGAFSFDAATFELWGMLLNGHEVHIVRRENLFDVNTLKTEISERNITTLWLTVSWFNQIVEDDVECFRNVRYLLVGGDALSEPHIKQVQNINKDVTIINGYGPTENTTFSICYTLVPNEKIYIGKPISNSTAYILDENKKLLPKGAIGEIYLGGLGLSRGYLNQPELTAQVFVPNVFESDNPKSRLYRTGDLGRYSHDGNIEFVGRTDSQVKIRGNRVELGEVESAILRESKVSETFVYINEEKELRAYLASKEPINLSDLRKKLSETLPEYMIPSKFYLLESFPLNINGKIDKSELFKNGVMLGSGREFSPPVSENEKKLVAIWERILERHKIGLDDNFFELGGNSFKIIELKNQVNSMFDSNITVAELFHHTTVRQILERVEPKKEVQDIIAFDV